MPSDFRITSGKKNVGLPYMTSSSSFWKLEKTTFVDFFYIFSNVQDNRPVFIINIKLTNRLGSSTRQQQLNETKTS